MKKSVTVNKIRCKYEGASGNRYGNYTLRFRADEQDLASMTRSLLHIDKNVAAAIKFKDTVTMLGKVAFNGLRIDKAGESVLSLEVVDEQMRFNLEDIKKIVDEYVTLKLAARG